MENFKQSYGSQINFNSSQANLMEYQLLKEKRDKLKLDLTNISDRKHKFQSILTSPDLKMLKLASPELEKLILSQPTLFTPTPTQYFFPNKPATEEQELYARGFFDALANIKQKYQNSFAFNNANPNYVSFVNNRTNTSKGSSDFPTIYFPSSFTNSFYSNESQLYNTNVEASNTEIAKIRDGQNEKIFNKYPNNGELLSCIFFNNYNFPGQKPNPPELNVPSLESQFKYKTAIIPPIPHYPWTSEQNARNIAHSAQQDNSIESLDQSISYTNQGDAGMDSSCNMTTPISISESVDESELEAKVHQNPNIAPRRSPANFSGPNPSRCSPFVGVPEGPILNTSTISDLNSFDVSHDPRGTYCQTNPRYPTQCHVPEGGITASELSRGYSLLECGPTMDADIPDSVIANPTRQSSRHKSSPKSSVLVAKRSSHPSTCSSSRRSISSTDDFDERDENMDEDGDDDDGDSNANDYGTAASYADLSPINLEAQEKIKIERKRLRNRIAATKCRRRKLERIFELEKCVAELKELNQEAQARLQNTQSRVQSLRTTLERHSESGCRLPKDIAP